MSKTINSKLLVRRDSSSNWTTNNPVLSQGEIGYDTNEGKIKVGNGSSNWSSLPFFALENEDSVQSFIIEASQSKESTVEPEQQLVVLNVSKTQIEEAIKEKKQLILKLVNQNDSYGLVNLSSFFFSAEDSQPFCYLFGINPSGYIMIAPSDWADGEQPVASEAITIPFQQDIPFASDEEVGLIKTASDQGIYTDIGTGRLTVQGRLGQFNQIALYYPKDIDPVNMKENSLLITSENNAKVGARDLAVTTGFNVNLTGSHAANSTTYSVTNNYANRIICAMAKGGTLVGSNAAVDIGNVTSVQINGADYTPDSSADAKSYPIVITVDKTINPSQAVTSIRVRPPLLGFSSLFIGAAGSNSNSFGYSAAVGQMVYNESNASAVFGNSQYNKGNSSLLAGRQHINSKMNAFLAGRGHDTTNGSDGVAAVGAYSNITSNTAFAVGNGTSHTSRKNAFQVTKTGKVILSIAPVDNMDAVNKGYVDTAIASIEAPQAESDANVILMLNQLGLTTNRSLQTGYVGTTKTGMAVASSYIGGGS